MDLATILVEQMPQGKRSANVTAMDQGLYPLVPQVGANPIQDGPIIVCV